MFLFNFGHSAHQAASQSLNIGFGLFGGGNPFSNYTDKYTYASDTVTGGTILGLTRRDLTAVGNSVVGIFGGGLNSNVYTNYTDKYTYANDAVAAGTVLGLARRDLTAVGNSVVGIFSGGSVWVADYGYNGSSYTDKYTYATNVVAAGTSLPLTRAAMASAGNDTFGIMAGGNAGWAAAFGSAFIYMNYTHKYVYAANTVAGSTVLGLARYKLAAIGNTEIGIFSGGNTSTNGSYSSTTYTDKYTYANATVAAGTVLGLAKRNLAGTSNATIGIFGGGDDVNNNYLAHTDKYTFSNNTIISGTVLGNARESLAAASSSPGGF